MPKGKSDVPVYKPYDQKQILLIPPSADELIPENHLVRAVNKTLDDLKILSLLTRETPGGGASRYHPLMMIKVFVYAYLSRVYSSRQIAKHLRENIFFRWLSGGQTPDFRTLNTFRMSTLKRVMEEVFVACVRLIASQGRIKLENYFVDGTKIEANANRYSFVWGNAVKTNEGKMDKSLRAMLEEIDSIVKAENDRYGDHDLEEVEGEPISSQAIQETVESLKKRLEGLARDNPAEGAVKKN